MLINCCYFKCIFIVICFFLKNHTYKSVQDVVQNMAFFEKEDYSVRIVTTLFVHHVVAFINLNHWDGKRKIF